MNKVRGFTLTELLISLTLMGIILFTIIPYSLFLFKNTMSSIEAAKMHEQVNFAFEHVRNHSFMAKKFETLFDARKNCWPDSNGNSQSVCRKLNRDDTRAFKIESENDIYNITPNNLRDNAIYTYFINAKGDFAFEKKDLEGNNAKNEILISYKYRPQIFLVYDRVTIDPAGNPVQFMRQPNLLYLTVYVHNPNDDKVNATDITEHTSLSQTALSGWQEYTQIIKFWYTDLIKE